MRQVNPLVVGSSPTAFTQEDWLRSPSTHPAADYSPPDEATSSFQLLLYPGNIFRARLVGRSTSVPSLGLTDWSSISRIIGLKQHRGHSPRLISTNSSAVTSTAQPHRSHRRRRSDDAGVGISNLVPAGDPTRCRGAQRLPEDCQMGVRAEEAPANATRAKRPMTARSMRSPEGSDR